MTKNWINFRFLHICPVEKCEISPNLAKIHISPHLLCGKTEIPLHVEKFHVLKSEISPHGRFLLHLHVGDRGDKYQVWMQAQFSFSWYYLISYTTCVHQRPKKSQLSGRQNFTRKNFPDKVRKLFSRHLCQKCVNWFRDIH